jgi:membrane-associated PAP2 superfamily phosphatase
LILTLVFANSSLDIAAARWFFRADPADHWPLAHRFPWPVLYRAASWITASLVVISLATLVLSFAGARRHWRPYAIFVLLAVVIGPGVLGNALLKDHWQHPRPREVIEFGGSLRYVPAPFMGHEGGASFPCGHCTVGFMYGIGWWVWRRTRPGWAIASLVTGLLLGSLLGAGRLAAGAHFLSDVAWSAWLASAVSHCLYYYVLRIPAQEVPEKPTTAVAPGMDRWRRFITVAAAVGGVGVLGVLFATPHGTALDSTVSLSALPASPNAFMVQASRANIRLVLVDAPLGLVTVRGELHGFGLPTSRLDARFEYVADPMPTLRYRIDQRGWFTNLDGEATVLLPAAEFSRIAVTLGQGDISVVDETRAGLVSSGQLQLDLVTGRGHVQSR